MRAFGHLARGAVVLAAGALVFAGLRPVGSASAAVHPKPQPTSATAPGLYVVTLRGTPTAVFAGRGGRVAHADALRAGQDRVLRTIGSPRVLYRYSSVLDGFAADLKTQQVKRLRARSDVVLVERSTMHRLDALRSRSQSDVASLHPTAGLWKGEHGPGNAGKGVVVGFVDSGIWPENPSFAALPQLATRPAGFRGSCPAAQRWRAGDCNDKIVAARWFVRGFGADHVASSEYLSPRDSTGHGTHAASTAAGDHGVPVQIGGQVFGKLSGMAPAARIAVYKACWTAPDPAHDGCTTADALAAVDRAVDDGVDVLNYSISGSGDLTDSLSRAFLNAAAAGVFVATSAGNERGRPGAIGQVSPWVTTVGASTRREFRGSVLLGDGTVLHGAMVSSHTVPATTAVLGGDVAAPGSSRRAARLCRIGALDAQQAQGKVVVCDRGVTARVDKSTAVAQAGGVGMVLANTSRTSVDADVNDVPTVHLAVGEARTLKAYLAKAGGHPTLSLRPGGMSTVGVPNVAGFSSRGPVVAAEGSLLKPDVTAPGVSVLGAVSPPADSGRLWDLESGTSTSSPHVAGLAADVLAVHHGWSPARVKSALMTTAASLAAPDGPFAGGAGHVDPARILDPGLAFDSSPSAWRRLLAGRLRPQDLNLASVAVGNLVGRTRVTRRVTNVSGRTETYDVRVSGLRGIDAVATPSRLTLAPGQTRRVTLLLAAFSANRLDRFAKGTLTMASARHEVRVPVVVRPRAVAAPREVHAPVTRGTAVVHGRAGTSTHVRVRSSGLVPATPTGVTLVPGPFDPAAPTVDASTYATQLGVPHGTQVVRVEMDTHNEGDDADVYVYRAGHLLGSSTSTAPRAVLTLSRPTPGRYTVYVNVDAAGNGSTTTGQLYSWVVPKSGGTSLSLTRSPARAPGSNFTLRASWHKLDPTKRWLGVFNYGDSPDHTLLQIN